VTAEARFCILVLSEKIRHHLAATGRFGVIETMRRIIVGAGCPQR